jgi:hypothetical protein
MMPHVVVDGRLVTGQNPFSTSITVEALVRALGRTPVARTPWREERTMHVVQQLVAGDSVGARAVLTRDSSDVKTDLVGLLGYYHLKAASTAADVSRALAIMTLAAPYMPAPQLRVAMAEAEFRLGRTDRAQALLTPVLAANPDLDEAKALQARLTQRR